jgi:hypothetical protein
MYQKHSRILTAALYVPASSFVPVPFVTAGHLCLQRKKSPNLPLVSAIEVPGISRMRLQENFP